MKKFSLLLMSALVAIGLSAQEVQSVSNGTTTYLQNKASDNWFMGLGGGINTYGTKFDNIGDRLGWMGQLSVGRWNSPVWGGRLVIDAGEPVTNAETSPTVKTKWMGGHLDLMYNLTNAVLPYNPERVYNFVPFIGVGYMYGMNDWFKKPNPNSEFYKSQNQTMTYNLGVINNFRLGSNVNLFVELGARLLGDSFDRIDGDYEYDLLLNAVGGIQFGLGGKQDFTPAELMDYNLINDLNSQINRLRAENEELSKRPVSCPECPDIVPVQEVESVYVPNVVFFRINSAVIDKGQQISVYNTAEYMKANPSATVKIVAYADKQTGTPAYNLALSERRAKAVADALTKEYGIDSSRISIDWKGDTEQPYAENDWNRVAIFFAE